MDIQNNKLINIHELSYKVDNKYLIDNISIQIEYGDFISIIGPNGSGKSTLIKLLSGEIYPSKGYVNIKDKKCQDWDIISLSKIRSILSQSNHLSFPFKVIDIVKMGRFPYDDKNKNQKICEMLIRKFDLYDYIERNYISLSGGEKQRVHLARIFSQIWSDDFSDKFILLDEPTSFLDIKHQHQLFKLLIELNLKGLTIVLVLHDLNHAIDISNKMILLKDSKLIDFSDKSDCITKDNLKSLFDIELNIIEEQKFNKKIITFKN